MKKKRKKVSFESSLGIVSIFLSIVSIVWIGGFQFSAIMHDIGDIKEEIKSINNRLDKMDIKFDINQEEHHQIDIRLNTLEQHKH